MNAVEQIKGKYLLDRRLGCGGMAEVFAGRALGLGGFSRPVAIKRILPGYSRDPAFRRMFTEEARLGACLVHSNIVSVLDFDEDEAGCLFLVMEYVDGIDLDGLMRTGPLPLPVILAITGDVLRGLEHAHQLPVTAGGPRGLVHRDISPQNVLLAWDGAVRISDFGIAKARAATRASASLLIKGKPAYMSPEQARGAPLDGRSDLFAVGVMLWELLCGAPLFHHEDSVEATLAAVLFGCVPSPRSRRPTVPEDVERVTMRLLEKQPEARYASATAALTALAACADARASRREELVALLAERFPDRAPRRDDLRIEAPSATARAADAPAQTPHLTMAAAPNRSLPELVDPFGSAAARQDARRQRRTRRFWLMAAGAAAGVAIGAVLHVMGDRGAAIAGGDPSTLPSASPGVPAAPSPPDTGPSARLADAPAPRRSESGSTTSHPGAAPEAAGGAVRLEQPETAARPLAPAGRSATRPREQKPRAASTAVPSGFREIDLRAAP